MNQKISSEPITVSKVSDTVISIAPPSLPVRFAVKVPFIQTDDFGNEVTLYRKEIVTREGLESQKQNLLNQVGIVDAKLEQIDLL